MREAIMFESESSGQAVSGAVYLLRQDDPAGPSWAGNVYFRDGEAALRWALRIQRRGLCWSSYALKRLGELLLAPPSRPREPVQLELPFDVARG